ncbi:MAG: hypothetical protein P4L41_08300 [Flavipsychrobacter sp.]|nr:hypothetical protein [Flavipsychrobacter sp.]
MKKLLAVFDGNQFAEGIIQFAKDLNELEPILLTGVFLPAVSYSDAMTYFLGGMAGPIYIPYVNDNPELIEVNIEKFEARCQTHHIEYRVHRDDFILDDLNKETRYADLLVLNSQLLFENLGEDSEDYLEDTIHRSECATLLIPEDFEFPQSIIIAYDGSASSVFALKQFAYLFPEFSELPTLIVYASEKNDDLPDLPYIEELAARHFKHLTFFKLETNPQKYFNSWLSEKGGGLLVTGSHGRSFISELFKTSFIRNIIKDHKLPLFVAHH